MSSKSERRAASLDRIVNTALSNRILEPNLYVMLLQLSDESCLNAKGEIMLRMLGDWLHNQERGAVRQPAGRPLVEARTAAEE